VGLAAAAEWAVAASVAAGKVLLETPRRRG